MAEQATPQYLTRAQMEEVVKGKGSILYKGKVLSTLEELPSEAELSAHEEDRHKEALASMQERKKNLEAEIARLESQPPPKAPAPPAAHPAHEHAKKR